jgi:hypothetical protein
VDPPLGVRAALGYGASWTDLVFGDVPEAAVERHAALVTGEFQISRRHTLQVSTGGVLGGSLELGERRFDIETGWVGAVAFAWRLLDGEGYAPFLLSSFSFSASSARTQEESGGASAHLVAIDLRGGLTAGKTFWGVLSPYVSLRVFGGPVLWTYDGEDIGGSDKYHYQPAVGAVVTMGPVDLYAEWAFLGERALAGGAGVSF